MTTLNTSASADKSLAILSQQEVLGKNFIAYGTVENPLFLAKDVAEWIEYSKTSEGFYNVSMMLKSVDDDEKVTINIVDSERKAHNQSFLTENGLYEVLMLSRKPIAKQFKKEVKKILHQIRMTGGYSVPKNFAEALMLAAKQQQEIDRLAEENQKLLPDAESWRAFAENSGNYCVTNIARCLNISRSEIFGYLQAKGYICRDKRSGSWIGTMDGVNTGCIANEIWTGEKKSGIQMRVTPKGMQKIADAFGKTESSIERTADRWLETEGGSGEKKRDSRRKEDFRKAVSESAERLYDISRELLCLSEMASNQEELSSSALIGLSGMLCGLSGRVEDIWERLEELS